MNNNKVIITKMTTVDSHIHLKWKLQNHME